MNDKNASMSASDPEFLAMSSLVMSLTAQCFESVEQANLPVAISHPARINILKYGYSSRTFQTLSTHFPRFRSSIGEEKWRTLGQQFAETDAFMSAQLGLLPLRFFDWLKEQKVSEHETLSYQLDHAVFEIGLEDFHLSKDLEFNLLNEQSKVILRPTVRLISGSSLYVVSRNTKEVFMQNVSADWLEVLNRTRTESHCLALSEGFESSEDFGFFLANTVKYHWLASV